MYWCFDCETAVENDNVLYEAGTDVCPICGSRDIEWDGDDEDEEQA